MKHLDKKWTNSTQETDVQIIKNADFLHEFIHAAPIGIVVCDAQGFIRLVNQETMKLFGYAEAEMIHQPIEMLMPKRYQTAHPGMMRLFFTDPTARPMGAGRDLYAVSKDGREFPVEIGLTPFETKGNKYVAATIVDITQRKNAERLLTKNRDLFNTVVEAAPAGIVMIDQDGRITLVNCSVIRART